VTAFKPHFDYKWIRDNAESIQRNIVARKAQGDAHLVAALYKDYVQRLQRVEQLKRRRNGIAAQVKAQVKSTKTKEVTASSTINAATPGGTQARDPSADDLIREGKRLRDEIAGIESATVALYAQLEHEAYRIPNSTHPQSPVGGEDQATVLQMVGQMPQFDFAHKDHLALAERWDLFDFEAAGRVSGERFVYLKNEGMV